jgi:hypothetical protein
VLLRIAVAWFATARIAAHATTCAGREWRPLLAAVMKRSGIHRTVKIRIVEGGMAPATWGFLRPVILIPAWASTLPRAQKEALLLHELSHIRAGDWAFGMVARFMCAAYWFHPSAWWVARALRSESEYACDDRVLSAGVKLSDYAELLMLNADRMHGIPHLRSLAIPLGERDRRHRARMSSLLRASGLRARLAALFESGHDCSAPRASYSFCAAAFAVCIALPAGLTSLNPSRGMLTDLMADMRWESRAYAVRGLAQRPDSIAMAKFAADADPSPRVRAVAASALRQQPSATSQLKNSPGAL